jgi:molecular chaperone GrpE
MENDAGITEEAKESPGNASDELEEPADNPQADDLKRQIDEMNDRYLRLAADFDNYRKRMLKEQERIVKHANHDMALEMLEVIDNLERASRFDDSHIREGLAQIQQICTAILQRHGITPFESLGKAFNPAEHEAIAHVMSDKESGTVIDEVSRGYRMHDKIIRYAKVAVSKGMENKN